MSIIGNRICIYQYIAWHPVDNIACYKICVYNLVGKSVFLINEGKYLLCLLDKVLHANCVPCYREQKTKICINRVHPVDHENLN